MSRRLISLIALGSLAALAPAQFNYHSPSQGPGATHVRRAFIPGEVMVKVGQNVAAQFAASRPSGSQAQAALRPDQLTLADLTFVSRMGDSGWTKWSFSPSIDPRTVAKALRSEPGIVYAEPNFTVHAFLVNPNDADYAAYEEDPNWYGGDNPTNPFLRMWHLYDDDAMLGWSLFASTWPVASQLSATRPTIAIIDTGIDLAHPDFQNAGGTGNAVTQGGQIDEVHSGAYLTIQDGGWLQGGEQDGNGHGTHVAGLALAAANNQGNSNAFSGHGALGVGWPCQGLIIKGLDDTGNGQEDDVGLAIMLAADDGADVINLSLGSETYSQYIQDSIYYAFQKGTLVVCAGDESNNGNTTAQAYPAASSSALAVSANGPNYVSSSYTGFGDYVDVAAPGGDVLLDFVNLTETIQMVWSTTPLNSVYLTQIGGSGFGFNPDYDYLMGTSMACPQVAGAAGLYYASHGLHQTDGWSNVQVFRAIEKSAYGAQGMAGGAWETTQGYGCLDVGAMVGDVDARGSTVGAIKGIVYYGGTYIAGAQVKAQFTTGGTTYSTTCLPDGTYRFGALPPGKYKIWSSPLGALKTKYCVVHAGSDTPGEDFFCGPPIGDVTPPVVPFFNVQSFNSTSVTVKHWAYDTETGIDSILWQIGTTSGGSDVMAPTQIIPDGNTVTLAGLSLPSGHTYYLQGTYVNGDGLSTVVNATFGAPSVSGTITLSSWLGGTVPVKVMVRNHGSTTAIQTIVVNVSSGGAYSFSWNGTPGTYDLAFQGSHWLRKVVPNVTLSGAGSNGVNATLINGDVNGDNKVNATDYGLIKRSYLSTPSSPGWNPNADLNGDNIVNAADYAIVKRSYLHQGDP